MRRLWQTLSRSLSATTRGPEPSARARLTLEALEERWQPSTVMPTRPIPQPFPTVMVQPPSVAITLPNPMSVVGKTAELGLFNNLQITAMQQQADGSFTFNGTFRGHAIIGPNGAPHLGGPLPTTASIGFSGSWYDSMNLQHPVQYASTLNTNSSQATTWGTLNGLANSASPSCSRDRAQRAADAGERSFQPRGREGWRAFRQ